MSTSEMHPNALLAAQVVASAVLVDAIAEFPDRHIPFLRLLDHVPATGLRVVLQLAFLAGAVTLFSHRFERASCIVLGVVLLVAVLSSQPFFRYNIAFAGCLLFCLGFASRTNRRWLPAGQVAVLYLGATFNKLRSADWRSGRFLRAWAPYRISGQRYLFHSSLPADAVAKGLSWLIITTELFLLVVFVVRALTVAAGTEQRLTALWCWAVLVGVTFHAGMYVVTGSTYGIFVFVILASFLVLVDEPLPRPWRVVCLAAALVLAVVTRIDNGKLVLSARLLVAAAVALLWGGIARRVMRTRDAPRDEPARARSLDPQ
jgi:FtsH-binding integral membrane protein